MTMAAEIRVADDEASIRACFPVMQQLRPHLADADDFVTRWRRQQLADYRIAALWQESKVVALAGYRVQENLIHGQFLYVDDLVTLEEWRGHGLGEELIVFLKAETIRLGCTRLALDTAIDNVLAHRFYYRNGLLARALRFYVTVP